MSTIIIFPGQGSQRIGMASDFYDAHQEARDVFEEASDTLNLDMARLCFTENEQLHLTEYTQPSILTAEIAMLRSLEAEYGLEGNAFAGHSLGEYTALVAAGVAPLNSALKVVRERGRRMQQAVAPGIGSMAAIMMPDLPLSLLAECLDGLRANIANHNAPNQVVISGEAGDVQTAVERFQDTTIGMRAKVRMLTVSAPFHSSLMETIEAGFRSVLFDATTCWSPERSTSVASNTTGVMHTGTRDGLIEQLTRQISGTVHWVDNMNVLFAMAPERIIEIGPGRPLRGFLRGVHGAADEIQLDSITNLVSARRSLGIRGPISSPVGGLPVAPPA